MKLIWLILLLTCFNAWADSSTSTPKDIALYTYHYMPPYVINSDTETGLLYDVADFFNRQQSNYHFSVSYIPRKRLNHLLDTQKFDGMMIGVNPLWFKDSDHTTYLWSEPLMRDQDEIISHSNAPIEFNNTEVFYGKSVGGIFGFRYHTIDTLVDNGVMMRIDTSNESQLINMLIKKRFDFAIVSRATTLFYQTLLEQNQQLYFSSRPHDQYIRYIMAPKTLQTEFKAINTLIKKLNKDPEWQQKMLKYQTFLQPIEPTLENK
ncbi:substrate-binding periplasmic protein [Shewanella sp. OMA3-2]|uniref:substrate-binding periplasmic protein n=1 Tax=Shewanella sp. OMA3-2 TaxID=2908650 RepID=UPI001F24197C|nr:ABC transporter substrate-binding protein [Shewanella sp. OMA3-2]UJF20860.1 ABC transporter substrate-binding protein [Shewanella sp. OMA3-2]